MSSKAEVEITMESPRKISITFPAATKVALRRTVPLDQLLAVLRAPDADVQGQSADLEFLPGAPD